MTPGSLALLHQELFVFHRDLFVLLSAAVLVQLLVLVQVRTEQLEEEDVGYSLQSSSETKYFSSFREMKKRRLKRYFLRTHKNIVFFI